MMSTSASHICSNQAVIFLFSEFTADRSVSFLYSRTASLNCRIMLSRPSAYSSANTGFLSPGQGTPPLSSSGMLMISGASAILLCYAKVNVLDSSLDGVAMVVDTPKTKLGMKNLAPKPSFYRFWAAHAS